MVDPARQADIRILADGPRRAPRACGDSLVADREFVTLEKTL